MWTALRTTGARLKADRRGTTAIEYALIASLVAVAATGGMLAFGLSLQLLLNTVSGEVVAVTPPPPPPQCVVVGSACPK
jgi:pilus assembly protein Flp/PilA